LNDCGRGQCWTFRADEVFIQRSTTRSQALLYADDLSTESLNSQTGLNFPVATGFQVSAARQLWGCWSVEAGYFHLDGWEARASVPGDSYIVTDVNGGYFGVTDAYARYISAIYLGEINARYQWGDRLSLLAGFRMGELDERYRATGTEGAGIATLTSDAFNHLYGFQIGADAEVIRAGALRINGLCKAGVYANSASQATRRFDDFLDESQTATKNHTAFLGEAGLALTYQFSEHLAARAVYQAVWLEGVALAPEQLGATDFAGTAVVDTAGSMFYHGGGIGLELTF
jgi:hypothetical protein